MSEQKQIKKCTLCNGEFQGQFCSTCGKPQSLKRINGAYILTEIGSVLNFEKGILFTVRELLLRPGQSVRKFIQEDRSYLVKPIVYIIICSLVYTFLQQQFNFEDGYVDYPNKDNSGSTPIFEWVTQNYGYANILISIFIAFWIKIIFRKHSFNMFEILILLCFVIGTGMLIFSFFGVIDTLTHFKIIDKGFLIGVLYISWAIGQLFEGKRIVKFLKGFFSYLLGLMSFTAIVLLI